MKKLVFDRKKKNQKFVDSKMMGNEFKHFIQSTYDNKGYKEQR